VLGRPWRRHLLGEAWCGNFLANPPLSASYYGSGGRGRGSGEGTEPVGVRLSVDKDDSVNLGPLWELCPAPSL